MSNNQSHTFEKPFVTEGGATIPEPTIAYQTWGELNSQRDNVILVCHALTGNTAVDEWFQGIFSKGKALDPNKHFIICPNVLGSCYGSSGPTSINPETEKPYRADFPKVTIRDIVRLQQQLFDELDINKIELVIGGSMGGMQALEWCIMDERPQSAVLVGMGEKHRPWAIGISHTQRQAIYNDPSWDGGFYSEDDPPKKGLALARMIAMNSYRHPSDFDKKFGRRLQEGKSQYEVESYLSYQGKKLVDRFDAVSYVRLTQAMDSHDIRRSRPKIRKTIAGLTIPIAVVGIDSDMLYPAKECQDLANQLPNSRYKEITSPHGHDAFLIEFDQLNSIVKSLQTELSQKAV
ncbi:homoserine O-acetyltransferase [Aliifodinibius salipaludis]|uniref:Homoserine O-acetyltransferase n=1 Tax=Fodinibius salipaludis TaxID=2032627 RepID=A0A2A2GA83_9BACT|nr:homoserine O-acetyltransferase [Aliifodinibius salipaludis]PAU94491.1 homoserine O-acetyltransferase [Aliifodinibius salipaludis]